MKNKILPENILKRMRPEDREPLGKAGQTNSEASEKFNVRNERALQKLVKSELLRRGIPYFWSRTDKRTRNTIGQPDFILCLSSGIFGFIECKFGAGELSVTQEKIICHLRMRGAIGIVTDNFIDVKIFLDRYA